MKYLPHLLLAAVAAAIGYFVFFRKPAAVAPVDTSLPPRSGQVKPMEVAVRVSDPVLDLPGIGMAVQTVTTNVPSLTAGFNANYRYRR